MQGQGTVYINDFFPFCKWLKHDENCGLLIKRPLAALVLTYINVMLMDGHNMHSVKQLADLTSHYGFPASTSLWHFETLIEQDVH